MLLGCCHCEGTTSSSSASSSSGSSSGSSSASVEPLVCGICTVLPLKWQVVVAGWTGLTAPLNACCGAVNATYTCYSYDLTPALISQGYCAVWRSDELANDARGVTPPCVPVGTRRTILMGVTYTTSPATTTLVVSVSIATSGTSPITYQVELFTKLFTTSAACLVGGTLAYVTETGTGLVRCSPGTTVTATPI